MSWSFEFTGTPAAVTAAVIETCDKMAASYEGKEEAKDILAIKERIVSCIGALLLDESANAVNAKASGSHATNGDRLYSANCSMQVQRIALKL